MGIYYHTIQESHVSESARDHYHSTAISDINAAAKANIPSNAHIDHVIVKLKMYHETVFGTLGSADVNVWFCNNGDDNDGDGIITDKESSTSSQTWEKDIISKVDKTYPFAINSSYSRIAVFYDSSTKRVYHCEIFEIRYEYTLQYTFSASVSPAGSGTLTGAANGTYSEGTEINISATPSTGYRLKEWVFTNNNGLSDTITAEGDYATEMWGSLQDNTTITAVFEKLKYTVNFKNQDGTIVSTDTVEHGTVPTYNGSTPTKASTAQYTYAFSGWSPSLGAITGDTTYTAQFTSRRNGIYAGTSRAKAIYVGTTPVKAIYIGTTKVYEQ